MRIMNIVRGLVISAIIWFLLAVLFRTVFSWEDSLLAAAVTLVILIGTAFIASYVFLFFSAMSDERRYRKGKYDR